VAPKNHEPSGKPPWTRLLLSGVQGSRKSGTAAWFTTDTRLGGTFWLEIGVEERTAEEYGIIPGANYKIIDHDGTFVDIIEQLEAHWWLAKDAEDAGLPPIALTVDSMGGLNEMIMDMGDARARAKRVKAVVEKYGEDARERATATYWSADYDATISYELRALIKKRHNQFMRLVHSWPGPVTLLTRERMAAIWENGAPTDKKDWSVDCRKELPGHVDAHVRLHLGGKAEVLKLRSGKEMIAENPRVCPWPANDFSIAKLIFDWVGCDPAESRAPLVRDYDADQDMPDEITPDNAAQRAAEQQAERDAQQRERVAQQARELIRWLLTVENVDQAAVKHGKAEKHKAAQSNTLPFLDEDVRERLGIAPDVERFTLVELGARHVEYVGKHKRSALHPLDDAPAEEPPPARKALEEHADEMLTAHNGDQATRRELEDMARDFNPHRMAQEEG
jgi:hypothetical protein